MEHRWNKRKAVVLRVALHRRNLPVEVCSAHDISLGGMFIVCGPQKIRKFDCVDLEFSLPLNDQQVRFRMPVMVMHAEDEGVGVMFKRMEPKIFSALQQLFGQYHHHELGGGSAMAQPTGQTPLEHA